MGSLYVFVISTVLYACLNLTLVQSAPVPIVEAGPWINPCGGSDPIQEMSFISYQTPPPRPISEDLTSLRLMLETAEPMAEEVKFITETRIGQDAKAELEQRKYTLNGFPDINETYTTGITIENMLLKEFERISKIGVFLEQAAYDTYDYKHTIRHLEEQYVEILCQMDLTLGSLNQEVTSPVSRDIMQDYRDLTSISQIDQRNFLIMRDTVLIFDVIKTGISQYRQEHN